MNTNPWMPRLVIVALISLLLSACNTGFGRSGNRNLEQLLVSAGTLSPSFDSDTRSYELVIGVSSVTFTATAASSKASMKLNGTTLSNGVESDPQSLAIDEVKTFEIVVTAENELRKTYEIEVTREPPSSDANLSALSIAGGELDPEFSPATTSYSVSLSYLANATSVTAERSNNQATVTSDDLSNETLNDNEASDELALDVGAASITLDVLAGDQISEETYTIAINRAPQIDLATSVYFKASNSDEADFFGSAIAFDSGTLVVGAPQEDSNSASSESSDLATNSGAIYTFALSDTGWEQSQYIKSNVVSESELFGSSVAIDENTMVVGAPGNESDRGRVYILERSSSDANWVHDEEETASDVVIGDTFGSAVDIFGDYIAVGAPARSSDAGAVYIFERDGTSWSQSQSIFDTNGNGRFGEVLAFNRDSENPELVVGSPNENSAAGAVRVYELIDDEWVLDSEDGLVIPDVSDTNDRFGSSIAIKNNRLVVGAPGEASNANDVDEDDSDNSLQNSGAAYVFERTSQGSSWEQEHYFKATRDSDKQFGSSIAMSANMIAVGAPLEDSNATGIDGDDSNTSEINSGAVYVFERFDDGISDPEWQSQIYVKASNTEEFDQFGQALAFSGSYLFVAAPNEDGGGSGVDAEDTTTSADAGAVYLVD